MTVKNVIALYVYARAREGSFGNSPFCIEFGNNFHFSILEKKGNTTKMLIFALENRRCSLHDFILFILFSLSIISRKATGGAFFFCTRIGLKLSYLLFRIPH